MNIARVKAVLAVLIIFLVLIQIFQPKRTNPPALPSRSLSAHVKIPPDVYADLLRSCGDCHSDQTHWPWYSHIAPLSWVITDDVNEGRRHMNFDDWEALQSPKDASERLTGICEEIKKKGMPPVSYRLAHEDFLLNSQQITMICAWSQSFQANPSAPDVHP